VATIIVDGDVDGGPPGGAARAPTAAIIIVDEDVDAGPPGSRRTHGGPRAAPDCVVHAEVNHTWERVICMSRLLS
jgi:hypothetical protein